MWQHRFAKMATYEEWKIPKLKTELRNRGAVVHGRKENLIDRLDAYDRNDNFRNEDRTPIAASVLVNWPKSGFNQLIPSSKDNMPPVSEAKIEGYFVQRVSLDRQKTGDLKALEKGRKLMQGVRLRACSTLIKAQQSYYTGICQASMKKKLTYNYMIKVNRRGDVSNSHCECPAGKGPHGTCKHIAAALYVLVKFKDTGELLIQKSCTDDLQTFHVPTSTHTGSPVQLHPKEEDDDPRPLELRNRAGHQDFVYNLTINYMASMTIPRVALAFHIPRANMTAAAKDHDYLSRPMTEYWVAEAVQVDPIEAEAIEKVTRGQHRVTKWFEHCQWRITASKFGDVCLAKTRDMSQLCKLITHPPSLEHVDAINHGLRYESVAKEEFEKKIGKIVKPSGLFIDCERPYLGASPDGLVDENDLIEIKCSYAGCEESSVTIGKKFPYLQKDQDGKITLKPRHKYMFQVQGQLHIARKARCYFVVHIFEDLFVEEILYDKVFVESMMLPKLDTFYEDHFKAHLASVHFP